MNTPINKPNSDTVADWHNDEELYSPLVLEGFQRAVRRAIRHHHADGRSLPQIREGKLVNLMPDESVVQQKTK